MKSIKQISIAFAVLLAVIVPSVPVHAAGNASLSLNSRGSATTGSTIAVSIYENGDNINVVTANLSYDQTQLQYVSVNAAGSAFASNASTRGGGGSVEVSRFIEPGSQTLSGSQLVAVVNFKALGAGTNTSVSTANGSIIADANGTDVWNGGISSTSIALSAPAPVQAVATPAPTPEPTPTPTPTATPTPAAVKATPKAATVVETKKSSNVLPAGLIVIAIAIIVAAYIYIRRRNEKPVA